MKVITLAVLILSSKFSWAAVLRNPSCLTRSDSGRETLSLSCVLAKANQPKSGYVFHPTPLVTQARDYTCGVAALQSVLAYYGDDEFMEGTLAHLLQADSSNGTSYHRLLQFFSDANSEAAMKKLKKTKAPDEVQEESPSFEKTSPPFVPYLTELHAGKSQTTRPRSQAGEDGVPVDGMSRAELKAALRAGYPVILALQGWAPQGTSYRQSDSFGHYAVAVGFSPTHVFLMDPSTTGNYTVLRWEELSERWHDFDGAEKIRHFGLVVKRRRPSFNFDALSTIP